MLSFFSGQWIVDSGQLWCLQRIYSIVPKALRNCQLSAVNCQLYLFTRPVQNS